VADRSEWHQKRGLDSVLAAAGQDLGGVLLHGSPLAVLGGDAVIASRQTADPSGIDELLKAVDGEERVEVVGVGVLLCAG
jgi:hypothetical protein